MSRLGFYLQMTPYVVQPLPDAEETKSDSQTGGNIESHAIIFYLNPQPVLRIGNDYLGVGRLGVFGHVH